MNAVLRFLRFLAGGWPTRILAALFLSAIGSVAYVASLISVIGIPVAMALLLLPAAAALYVGAEIGHQLSRAVRPGKPVGRWVFAVGLATASLIVGQGVNMRLAASARAMTAGDFEAASRLPVAKLGLTVDNLTDNPNYRVCNELCLRVLISGAAKEVLLTGPVDPARGPQPGAAAMAAKFVRLGACPRQYDFPEPPNRSRQGDHKLRADYADYEEARRRQKSGVCLVETKTTLGAADAVVAVMETKRGVSAAGAGFDLAADTISAKQVSFYRREGGRFVERARKTAVRYLALPVAAVPTYVSSHGLNVEVAIGRWPSYLNADGRLYANHGGQLQSAFLSGEMGLNLDLFPTTGD